MMLLEVGTKVRIVKHFYGDIGWSEGYIIDNDGSYMVGRTPDLGQPWHTNDCLCFMEDGVEAI
jgi:hypothetical protein